MLTSSTVTKREYWYAKNVSSNTFSLGDLPLIPTFGPNASYDLLAYYDKNTILQSTGLITAAQNQWIEITTVVDGVPTVLDASDIQSALSPDDTPPVTIGTANGLTLSSQQLSLVVATETSNGAMLGSDKAKLNHIVDVKSFSTGNPVGVGYDDTSAIIAAIAAVTAIGGEVQLGSGSFVFSGTIYVPAGVKLRGSSPNPLGPIFGTTLLQLNDSAQLVVNGNNAVIEGIGFRPSGSTSSGSPIALINNPINVQIVRCAFLNVWMGIDIQSAVGYVIDGCLFQGMFQYGIQVDNVVNPDQGDGCIINSFFGSNNSHKAGVFIKAGGGIKIANNKIIEGLRGIDLQVKDGASTADLLIRGNSIEGQTIEPIRLGISGTTGSWTRMIISDNQMSAAGGITAGNSTNLYNISITDNIITYAFPEGGTGTNVGITIGASSGVHVQGNQFDGYAKAISIASTAQGTKIGENQYTSTPIPIEDFITTNNVLPDTVVHKYSRRIIDVATYPAYNTLWQIDFNAYQPAMIELTFLFLLGGVGSAARNYKALVIQNGSDCTVNQISDVASGAVIDIQLDTVAIAGSVVVGVRHNSGAGGTTLTGIVKLSVDGRPLRVTVL